MATAGTTQAPPLVRLSEKGGSTEDRFQRHRSSENHDQTERVESSIVRAASALPHPPLAGESYTEKAGPAASGRGIKGIGGGDSDSEVTGPALVQPPPEGLLKKKKKKKMKDSGGNRGRGRRVKLNTKATSTTLIPRQQQQQRAKEMFRPSCDAYTPRMDADRSRSIRYRPTAQRTPQIQSASAEMGTIQRPNFRDALKRVAMILQQHVVKIERRLESEGSMRSNGGVGGGGGARVRSRGTTKGATASADDTGSLFSTKMRDEFAESNFATPRYKCSIIRLPLACPGAVYGLRKIRDDHDGAGAGIPTVADIYDFGRKLFQSVRLSSECSIVCLIYVERLMETARVPLTSSTWRPVFMCGLLLASKVWQDLSSWNVEFSHVYPRYSLDAINRLEAKFLKLVKWDLYISASLYAKYFFALRSLLEKRDFRQRYNEMVGAVGSQVAARDSIKVQLRSEKMKEEVLDQLSQSM